METVAVPVGGRIYLSLTEFIRDEFHLFSRLLRFSWIHYHVTSYPPYFSFLVLFPPIGFGAYIVDLMVPALRTKYAIQIPSYRERPVTGHRLTHLG